MAHDKSRYRASSGTIPGLHEMMRKADARLADVFAQIHTLRDLRASYLRGLDRIRQMQDQAKAGEAVDLSEFQTLRVAVEDAEKRIPEMADEIEAKLAELDKMPNRVGSIVRQALHRRDIIAKGGTHPGGRA
jgi:hypothetical protein